MFGQMVTNAHTGLTVNTQTFLTYTTPNDAVNHHWAILPTAVLFTNFPANAKFFLYFNYTDQYSIARSNVLWETSSSGFDYIGGGTVSSNSWSGFLLGFCALSNTAITVSTGTSGTNWAGSSLTNYSDCGLFKLPY